MPLPLPPHVQLLGARTNPNVLSLLPGLQNPLSNSEEQSF